MKDPPQSACKPNPVSPPPRLAALRRGDDHSSSPVIADGIKRPTRRPGAGRPRNASLFGLAPCGVLPATRVTAGAVRSYRTFSPLPSSARRSPSGPGELRRGKPSAGLPRRSAHCAKSGRYIFCATFLQVTLTGRYPAHCPAEFGLSSLPAVPLRTGGNSGRLADCGGSVDRSGILRPGGCCTAPASCTGYCAACRSPRQSSRCSSRSPGASPGGTPSPRTP